MALPNSDVCVGDSVKVTGTLCDFSGLLLEIFVTYQHKVTGNCEKKFVFTWLQSGGHITPQ